MNLTDAQAYVARIYGGSNNADKLSMAADSIKATAEMWVLDHDWHFLLNDQTISVIAGTDKYALTGVSSSKPFSKPFSLRFTGTLKHPLRYRNQETIDAMTTDQTVQGTPSDYTVIDDDADFVAGAEVQKVKLFPIPAANDTALLRYYRVLDATAATLDVPQRYLYTFLDCARIHFLQTHDSANPRLPALILDIYGNARQVGRYHRAIMDDLREGGQAGFEGFMTLADLANPVTPYGIFDFYPRGDR